MGSERNGVPDLFGSLEWRCIGPHRGGRVVAVAGDPIEPMVFYFGACAGGVWKTSDGGTYWENVSDGYFNTAAVGAIAVSESDPNVVYVGTGESCIRGNVSHGDGVYRSTDAGKSWINLGLEDTRHIARIRIHPRDPDLVYVAALGHAFGPNTERGIFRSTDGGKNWEKVLYRSEKAGAADLSMDPHNPRILYAAIWEALRQPWKFTSGGSNSGLFKSTDGGDNWTEITDNPGLPEGLKGRIGVAVSPAQTGRIWAIVEAEDGALFRSDDGGDTWEKMSDDRNLVQRPWYYSHVFADPGDAETVYVLALKALKSTDGGRTFTQVATPHGDNHDLWIDPRNPQRMIEGNDGGACVSFNGGASWSTIYNQPTAQFYHLTTDSQFPYRVYGTQQDNSAISVPSRTSKGAIPMADCYIVGSSESGHIAVHPEDPNIVYSGAIGSSPGGGDSLLRYDHRTGQTRIVTIWPELLWGWDVKDHRYRFQWTYPILFSPHDPNVLYAAGNVVFRSESEGDSWEAISPDLTRADETKMEASGGPITLDTSGVEYYGTIFCFVESPHDSGVFWAGSDDGLVHISRDGGGNWENVTPQGLPEWSLINTIELSPHDSAAAYVSATRYKLDDTHPYLYKTGDYGKTWQKITGGIPDHDFTRVVREDPVRRGLLYAGTETGVYISFNDGARWQPLRRNLPTVPVHDMAVRENELVVATHGRSFWILDDLALIRQLAEADQEVAVRLFKPADTYRTATWLRPRRKPGPGKRYMLDLGEPATYYEKRTAWGENVRTYLDAGANPPNGAVVSFYLKQKPEQDVTLTFLDSKGQLIKQFSSKTTDEPATSDGPSEPSVQAEPGMNRFVWDMRYPEEHRVEGGSPGDRGSVRPLAPSGTYQVRLAIGDQTQTEAFELLKDPRVAATPHDLEEQFGLLIRIRDRLSETHDAISRIRSLTAQVEEWASRAGDNESWEAVPKAAQGIQGKLKTIEEQLIQAKASQELDRISRPARLNYKLAALTSVVSSADSAPTKQSYDVFDHLSTLVDEQLTALQEVVDTDLAAFVSLVHELEIPPVVPKPGL